MAFKRMAPCTCGEVPHQSDCERKKQQDTTEARLQERLRQMATFDDLFGGKSNGGGQWMKFDNDGEAFLVEQTGEIERPEQKGQNGRPVWLVQTEEGGKYKPVEETADFDQTDYENAFKPQPGIAIPVKVLAKKLKDGSKADGFEPFDTLWELNRDEVEKLKEAMLDTGLSAEPGQRYTRKRLNSNVKPYKYSIKMIEPKQD